MAALLGEVGPISDLLRVPPGSVSVLGRTPEGRLVYSVLLPASGDEGRPVVAGGLSAYLSVVARDLVVEAPPPPPLDTVWD